MSSQIKKDYKNQKKEIQDRLKEFRSLPEKNHIKELYFCLLTPQSNAFKCWDAVEKISALKSLEEENVKEILKTRTRFHNNKTINILKAAQDWPKIKTQLKNPKIPELRIWLAKNVRGLGLKESAHFLRNIGRSNNQIAILDRHILRNLHRLNLISEQKIKSPKHYLEIEKTFIDFANSIAIPPDELDLFFWKKEVGEVFK